MLKSVIHYLMKTPWKAISADIEEYQWLNKQCSVAYRRFECAESALVKSVHFVDKAKDLDKVLGCVKRTVVYQVDPTTSEMVPYMYSMACDNFDKHFGCPVNDCPFFGRNKDYVDAKNEYERLNREREIFWRNRITKIRQR